MPRLRLKADTLFPIIAPFIEPFSLAAFNKISCYLLERAAQGRFDIMAAQKRPIATRFILQGAKNQMLPKLDVVGGVTRKNFSIPTARGSLGDFIDGPAENDWSIGLNFSIPLHNDKAKGDLRQAYAREMQAEIRIKQLLQLSLKDMREALSNQIMLYKNLLEAEEAVKENRLLVVNESKKLSSGFSTIFFLIDFENRLTDALLRQVEIHKEFLQNIARIRFLSATLFIMHDQLDTIEPKNLTFLHF
jgi:outer membrane protein TolC